MSMGLSPQPGDVWSCRTGDSVSTRRAWTSTDEDSALSFSVYLGNCGRRGLTLCPQIQPKLCLISSFAFLALFFRDLLRCSRNFSLNRYFTFLMLPCGRSLRANRQRSNCGTRPRCHSGRFKISGCQQAMTRERLETVGP